MSGIFNPKDPIRLYQYGSLPPLPTAGMVIDTPMSSKQNLDDSQFADGTAKVNFLERNKKDDYIMNCQVLLTDKFNLNYYLDNFFNEPQKIFFVQVDEDNKTNPVKIFWNYGNGITNSQRIEEAKAAGRDATMLNFTIRLFWPFFFECTDQDLTLLDLKNYERLKYDTGLKYDATGTQPADISGLVMHFDFTDQSSMSILAGNKVESVNEQPGGGGRTLTQVNDTNRPIFTNSLFGTQSGLQFNQAQELNLSSAIDLTGEYTIFTVLKNDVLDAGTRAYLGNDNVFLEGYSNTSLGYRAVNSSGADTTTVNWSTGSNNTLVTSKRNSSNTVSASLNNTALTNLFSSAAQTGTRSIKQIGSRGAGFYWGGAIAEVIIYNKFLTPPETKEVQTYISNKYDFEITNLVKTESTNFQKYDTLEWSTTKYLSELSPISQKKLFGCFQADNENFIQRPFRLQHKDRFWKMEYSNKKFNQLVSSFDCSSLSWLRNNVEVNPDVDTFQIIPGTNINLRYAQEIKSISSNGLNYVEQDEFFVYRGENKLKFKIKTGVGASKITEFQVYFADPNGGFSYLIKNIDSGTPLGDNWYEHEETLNVQNQTNVTTLRIQFYRNGGNTPNIGSSVFIRDLELYSPDTVKEDHLIEHVCGNKFAFYARGQNALPFVAKTNDIRYIKHCHELDQDCSSDMNIMSITIDKMENGDYFELINISNNTGLKFNWISDNPSPDSMLFLPHKQELFNAQTGEKIPYYSGSYFSESVRSGMLTFRHIQNINPLFDTSKTDVLWLTKNKFNGESLQLLIKPLKTNH